jgi:hypothetical protein
MSMVHLWTLLVCGFGLEPRPALFRPWGFEKVKSFLPKIVAPSAGLRQLDNLRSYKIGSSIGFAREPTVRTNCLESSAHILAQAIRGKLIVGEFAHSRSSCSWRAPNLSVCPRRSYPKSASFRGGAAPNGRSGAAREQHAHSRGDLLVPCPRRG